METELSALGQQLQPSPRARRTGHRALPPRAPAPAWPQPPWSWWGSARFLHEKGQHHQVTGPGPCRGPSEGRDMREGVSVGGETEPPLPSRGPGHVRLLGNWGGLTPWADTNEQAEQPRRARLREELSPLGQQGPGSHLAAASPLRPLGREPRPAPLARTAGPGCSGSSAECVPRRSRWPAGSRTGPRCRTLRSHPPRPAGPTSPLQHNSEPEPGTELPPPVLLP